MSDNKTAAKPEASAYRALRVLLWPRRGIGPHRLLICGVAGGPGADEVGANLAVTIASNSGPKQRSLDAAHAS
mgnify:CR=1 FL=1